MPAGRQACALCGVAPGSFLRSYSTQVLCRDCFLADVEAQVHDTIQRHKLIVPGDVVGVGVSGGKDSATLLHILDLLVKRFPREYAGVSLKMVAVNEGIRGYRDESLACVEHCQRVYGHELVVVGFKEEFGRDLDELVELATGGGDKAQDRGTIAVVDSADVASTTATAETPKGESDLSIPGESRLATQASAHSRHQDGYYFSSEAKGVSMTSRSTAPLRDIEEAAGQSASAQQRSACGCSFCGILRRNSLTKGAERTGCTKLATGHNGDDNAETVLLNLMRGDWGKLSRCTRPGTELEGGVPRIKPLFFLSQKAVILYAYLRRLRFHSVPCPYAVGAFRGKARALLSALAVRPEFVDTPIRVISSVDGICEARAGSSEAVAAAAEAFAEVSGTVSAVTSTRAAPALRRCRDCGSLLVGTKCQTCEIAAAQTSADLWEALRVKPQPH